MSKDAEIKWLAEPEEHNYPAAASYLSLIYDNTEVERLLVTLRSGSVVQFKAKDIFRASGLSLLGVSNLHIEKDRTKILSGNGLSPLLLVRDASHHKLVVADGYHRLCAVYSYNEDALVPCKIA